MTKNGLLTIILVVYLALPGIALGADEKQSDLPWSKVSLSLGWFFADLDSAFRLGDSSLGLGIGLDVEDLFGLDSVNSSFRIDGSWRFTKNWRHKLDFGWFRFHRESSAEISTAIELPPELGGGTIGPGHFQTKFNFDIIRVMYKYSLILNDHLDFHLGLGFFVMPIGFGAQGIVDDVEAQHFEKDITAPLPVFGVGLDLMLAPKWMIHQEMEFFYLELNDFKGGIFSATLALEYLPWKHVGFGLGIDGKRVQVESNGADYPGIDFKGTVEFSYAGVLLYMKIFY